MLHTFNIQSRIKAFLVFLFKKLGFEPIATIKQETETNVLAKMIRNGDDVALKVHFNDLKHLLLIQKRQVNAFSIDYYVEIQDVGSTINHYSTSKDKKVALINAVNSYLVAKGMKKLVKTQLWFNHLS